MGQREENDGVNWAAIEKRVTEKRDRKEEGWGKMGCSIEKGQVRERQGKVSLGKKKTREILERERDWTELGYKRRVRQERDMGKLVQEKEGLGQ